MLSSPTAEKTKGARVSRCGPNFAGAVLAMTPIAAIKCLRCTMEILEDNVFVRLDTKPLSWLSEKWSTSAEMAAKARLVTTVPAVSFWMMAMTDTWRAASSDSWRRGPKHVTTLMSTSMASLLKPRDGSFSIMLFTVDPRRPVLEGVGPVKRGTKTFETAEYAVIAF